MKFLHINIFILLLLHLNVYPQNQHSKFYNITINDGLSDRTVTSILQDSRGFIWIGTMDGLNKFDGYNFKVYRYEHGNRNSLSDYAVNSIAEDKNGIIWIATREGLNSFDPKTETFKVYKHDPENRNTLSNNFVTSLLCHDDDLWIGTRDGLNKFNLNTEKFTIFKNDSANHKSLSYNYINDIKKSKNEILWIATNGGGLNKYDIKSGTFSVFKNDPQDENSISANITISLAEDSKNRLWIGTMNGLDLLYLNDENKFFHFRNSNDPYSISSNHIRSIDFLNSGDLIIATMNGGLNIFSPESEKFIRFNYQSENAISDILRTVFVDKSGIAWIGSDDKGVYKFSPNSQKFSHINYSEDNRISNSIFSFLLDSQNNFLLGSESGLYQINSKSFSIEKILLDKPVTSIIEWKKDIFFIATFGYGLFTSDKNTITSLSDKFGRRSNFIHTLFKDKEGIIWIGTGLGGLIKYNPETDDYKIYQHNPENLNTLSTVEVTSIVEDDQGFLWIGTTTGGLNKFDKEKEIFYHYKPDPANLNSLNSMRINTILLDKKGNLWIGTFGGGLNKFDRKNSFSHYTTKNGLPGNIVVGIVEDKKGNIWISTTKGISKFNPAENSFKNYDISDGLQENEFLNNSSYYYDKTGYIFFGGVNGFNFFHPDSIKEDSFIPPVIITDFKIFNASVPIGKFNDGKKSPLIRHISFTDEIILPYNNNTISFDFVSLHFANPAKNQYAYKLEGFDDDWIFSGNSASYTNLDPGSYIFKVKGTNSDGVWNDKESLIKLVINPPWWKTWWAYSLYAILFISLLLFARRYEMNRIRLKNNLERKEFEAKKLNEIDHMKSRFFANISHEFRTPLTLILGITNKYLKNNKDDISDFKVIKKSAQRLLQLINQLLELSKLESGNISLNVKKSDLFIFIRRVASSFISLAEQKNIEFTLNKSSLSKSSEANQIFVYFDHEKMETIVYNLLSNAFKFTPGGEKINIDINSENERVKIKITNTGIGISEEHLPYIFDRFYQADNSETRGFEGTGIGLALVKELVELHEGEVKIETVPGKETTFTVYLPLGKEHFSEEQTAETDEAIIEKYPEKSDDIFTDFYHDKVNAKNITPDSRIILIVEDNFDLRNFIKEQLENDYSVMEAEDGEKGLKVADEIIPDLIISDIMMPKMDGYQLCKKLKTNLKTNHIPVILLTAKASLENKLEGLETGADDYLIKPFNTDELKARVKNLINIRQKMREKFQSEMILKPAEVIVPSSQKIFIEKLIKIIDKNIEDENFSIEILSKEIGISRSQLHRKIKAVTNQSTSEFIRNYRLQRAADLIKKSAGNMAEISYKVGFNSQAYFTKSFQEVYGCTPTEFKNKTSANPENLAHDKKL